MIHILKSMVVLIAVLLFSASAVLAAPSFVPGMWEITTQIDMPGMPIEMPKYSLKQCLNTKVVIPSIPDMSYMSDMSEENQICTVKNMKVRGNTVTWTVYCKIQGMESTSKVSITYRETSFSGMVTVTMTSQMGTQSMTQTMEGKRIGKCTQ